ncbi:unnamed protein product [Pleuronectes platessa]|uniref:Uncharacterized protein n=1 Tax=Pleuronectes platessa TaxID=8262 RepID=A0A9N7V7N9_PLEPL|nr:unnamed protein product [Pleuronectes platessa]
MTSSKWKPGQANSLSLWRPLNKQAGYRITNICLTPLQKVFCWRACRKRELFRKTTPTASSPDLTDVLRPLKPTCKLHSSQAALDPGLTATLIISQSDRVAGPACLSPVLNHSIIAEAAAGGGGGGGGGGRGGGGRRSEISLFPY